MEIKFNATHQNTGNTGEPLPDSEFEVIDVPVWVQSALPIGSSFSYERQSDGSIRWFVDGKEVREPDQETKGER